jgi:hypothetical protein
MGAIGLGCVADGRHPAGPAGRADGLTIRVIPPDLGSASPLDFATYDGSRQVVHPDIAHFPGGWNGHEYWTAITPYPYSNRDYENPSLFTSEDGERWSVPAGITNPLSRTQRGHLSDPDVIYNAERRELWMYFREAVFKRDRHVGDRVVLTMSSDGVHWSTPGLVFGASRRYLLSPSVTIGPDDTWRVWTVDAGRNGCSATSTRVMLRRSADGMQWTRRRRAALEQPDQVIWHIEVQYVPARREYWAIFAAYPRTASCTSTQLYLATSLDGETWTTYPTPLLARGAIPEFAANVYRSTFVYDEAADAVTFWFSGARLVPTGMDEPYLLRWSAAVGRTTTAALFARVSRPASTTQAIEPEPAALRALAERNAVP